MSDGAELAAAREQTLADAIATAHILVTTGAGGVGKTTSAAAIGLAGARQGRKVLVMTIDPARRLAQAMGLDTLASEPQQVEVPGADGSQETSTGGSQETSTGGSLEAMMLDMQSTFDDLIDRHATSPARARAIKSNRIYQTLSSSLSGTQEYMAMEKLHELHEGGEYDLLVIDTPPTRSALDFLDAPQRMTSFLEGRLLNALLKPAVATSKGIGRFVNAGATAFMRVAGKVTGMDLLEDLADFFANFEGMYEGFKRRADAVLALLREPSSQFVVVASPQPPPLREAGFFLDRLEQEGLHAAGVVVNRMHPLPPGGGDVESLREAAEALDDPGRRGIIDLLADTAAIAHRERRDVDAALYGRTPPALVEVPLLRRDVHDLDSLTTVAHHLTD